MCYFFQHVDLSCRTDGKVILYSLAGLWLENGEELKANRQTDILRESQVFQAHENLRFPAQESQVAWTNLEVCAGQAHEKKGRLGWLETMPQGCSKEAV